MSIRAATALLVAIAAAACADLFAPPARELALKILPHFADPAAPLADDADRLRILVERDSSGTFVPRKDTTVAIDPATGEAVANITVALLTTPQRFRITLQAIRSSSNTVLYAGVDTILVEESSGGDEGEDGTITIPVVYAGPRAASIVINPRETAVEAGSGFTFSAATFDAEGAPLDVPVRFELVAPGDSTALTVNRLSGVVTTNASVTQAIVLVRARTLDTNFVADTAAVAVGAVPDSVHVTPGFLNVAAGGTGTLAAEVFSFGTLLPVTATFVSRDPAVATVNAAGAVTGVAVGTAVIAAEATGAGTIGDSVLVTVPPAGNVVVRTAPGTRSFTDVPVGGTVVVDVMADMQFTPNERLGSYNATLTWNPAVLTYVSTQAGVFAAPIVNDANAASGELRFGAADATGATGNVVVARVQFTAAAAGAATPAVVISEMSAAQTFTNLIDRVTVTGGHVTVRP